MNKKDIANIRKQFKLDNEQLKIKEIFSVYVQKESGEIYHHVSQPFEMLERESQELLLINFKKVLTGQLDSKLFELKFRRDVEDSTQEILFDGLQAETTEGWKAYMLQIVEKMYANRVYEFDTVVTFIVGEYRKPMRKRDVESEEGGNDEVYANKFILCSLNKADQPKKALVFDYIEKKFRPNNEVDPIINLTSPLTGFLFPTFTDNASDVNHVLYSAGKANQPDDLFIEEVLNCGEMMTAAEDRDCFGLIVQNVIGDQVNSKVISNIYEEVDRIVQESEEDEEETETPNLDYRDVEKILKASGVEGVETEKVKNAFKTVIDDEKHEFKANSIVPKTIKIKTEVANLALSPKDLKNIKYITFDGKRCLLIEINDDVVVEGFQLETGTY
ncbi:DUF4317 domain-containing protein [Virgibacillus sp. 179-BFC.A HS]|uniref:DUF4317 domain-containing protein n=1 Tax=Tigheibacillus jepli TaxID=3035914 RepID=A0ABU5CK83_9BACI|nr:DUF4317 domain-containing protein [Virgibacillus sp. 179-BFC.A HS]MDY0406772.1 DUF4317 domain-containing protein [Virgibacillus sp. 179-BFC.A HS]